MWADLAPRNGCRPMIAALVAYNLVLLLISPLAVMYIIWGLIISDRSRRGMGERLGFIARRKVAGEGRRLWLHAVSVGETMAAKPIWEAMLQRFPHCRFFHSTTTDTGQAQAVRAVSDRGTLLYFPFDFLPCVWLALRRVRPELLVLLETELWPNMLAVARLMGVKVIVVNGRISERSLRGGKRLGPVYRWMTGNVDRFCMQSEEDARRIILLGADPATVVVVGNSKFDQVAAAITPTEREALRQALGIAPEDAVVLAGSTHPGEEEIVFSAFRQFVGAVPRARLVLAPRDISRAERLEEMAAASGLTAVRRTAIRAGCTAQVMILDTIGELMRAYALGTSAFVGGSLVNLGGHNILEPLASGRPAIFGPHMSNFRDIAALALEEEVGVQVNSAEELAAQWLHFAQHPEACRAIVERAAGIFQRYRGASARFVDEMELLIATRETPSRPTADPSSTPTP